MINAEPLKGGRVKSSHHEGQNQIRMLQGGRTRQGRHEAGDPDQIDIVCPKQRNVDSDSE
jgi:hypothetical protein